MDVPLACMVIGNVCHFAMRTRSKGNYSRLVCCTSVGSHFTHKQQRRHIVSEAIVMLVHYLIFVQRAHVLRTFLVNLELPYEFQFIFQCLDGKCLIQN